MDDKTLNLWRQIEGARRIGRREAGRVRPGASPSARGPVAAPPELATLVSTTLPTKHLRLRG